jgi:hypothetical protein
MKFGETNPEDSRLVIKTQQAVSFSLIISNISGHYKGDGNKYFVLLHTAFSKHFRFDKYLASRNRDGRR